jgi:hypothetical protein
LIVAARPDLRRPDDEAVRTPGIPHRRHRRTYSVIREST